MGIETTPHNLQSENTWPSTFNLLIMSNLLKKFTDQLSGPNNQQNSSSSGGILHKVTDAVTGQKHPQDYQNRPNPQTSGFGYGAGPGSGGYQNSGYPGILGVTSIPLPDSGSPC